MLKTKHKVALARLLSRLTIALRRLFGGGADALVRRRGIRWHLDLREGVDLAIYLFGTFEWETFRAYSSRLAQGNVVIDIGANIGAHTLPLASCVGDRGRVYAFEPTDFAFAKLKRNIGLNPNLEGRIRVFQAILVDRPDAESPPGLYSSWPLEKGDDLHPKLMGRLMSIEGARPVMLDSFVAEAGLDRVDFIKIDVDGHECSVFRGAGEVLRRFRPTLIMELSPYVLDERGGSVEELVSLLSDAGYGFEMLGSGKKLPSDADTLRRMIPDGAGINVLARPCADKS